MRYLLALSAALAFLTAPAALVGCAEPDEGPEPTPEAAGAPGVQPLFDYDGPICEVFCWDSPLVAPPPDAQCANRQCCKVFCY